jgi:hypothetical protein
MEKETPMDTPETRFTVCHNSVLIDIKADDFDVEPPVNQGNGENGPPGTLWFLDNGKTVAVFREWSWFSRNKHKWFRGMHDPYYQHLKNNKGEA